MRAFLTALAVLLLAASPAFAKKGGKGNILPATPENVWQVATDAQAGDTVQLTGGTYYLTLWGMAKTGEVILEPAPGAKVTASYLNLNGSAHWTVRNLHIVFDPADQYGVQVWSNAHDILLDGLKIESNNCDPATRAGVGAHFRYLNGTPDSKVVLKNSEISCVGSGIGISDANGVTIDHVKIHDISVDGILAAGTHNTVISNNSGSNFIYPEWAHPDFIQWFNSEQTTDNLTIKGNRWDRGTGGLVQGIFGEDGEHVWVDDNVIMGPMYNGIALARTKHFRFHHNYVQPLTVEGDLGSWIIVRQEADDGDLTDNGTPSMIIGTSGEPQPTNIRQSGTIITYPAAVGDNSQYEAFLAATGGTPQPPKPDCPCGAPLLGRIADLTKEVANLQFRLDAAQRRMDAAVRILSPPLPEPKR